MHLQVRQDSFEEERVSVQQRSSHLHYAIPVVSSGNSEEQQKRHPKVFECSVAAQTLTRVELITN